MSVEAATTTQQSPNNSVPQKNTSISSWEDKATNALAWKTVERYTEKASDYVWKKHEQFWDWIMSGDTISSERKRYYERYIVSKNVQIKESEFSKDVVQTALKNKRRPDMLIDFLEKKVSEESLSAKDLEVLEDVRKNFNIQGDKKL